MIIVARKISAHQIRGCRDDFATHLDFQIDNNVSKQTVLTVEVAGYKYHKEGTEQHERDLKKDHNLEVAGIPIIRLSTVGSNERERILCLLK